MGIEVLSESLDIAVGLIGKPYQTVCGILDGSELRWDRLEV
jgi:hypothetical protein